MSWKERLNNSRITGHISGRHLIQTEEKDGSSYSENEYQYLDEWIELAIISHSQQQLLERLKEALNEVKALIQEEKSEL